MGDPGHRRDEDDRFALLARATNDVIYDWSVSTGAIQWNAALTDRYGYPLEPRTSTLEFWADALHPDDRERVLADLDRAVLHGPDIWQFEYRFRRADGSYAEVLDRGILQRGADGKAIRMVGAMLDLTERKLMEARLRIADRMASVGTLAAGVAHEINNPLTFVITNLEIVTRELGRLRQELALGRADEPGTRLTVLEDVIGQASEGAQRVRRIVRDLRTFSRADEDRTGPVDLRRVIESALAMAHNEVVHRARVVRRFEAVPAVIGNEARLGQVVLNLIVNAAQALPEGAADRNEIRIVLRRGLPATVVLEVTDTGPGIQPSVLARIYDPFFTTKPVGVGTGLGLTIVHGIVTQLGGAIEVVSQLGHGASFRVTLPSSEQIPDRSSSEVVVAPEGPAGKVLVVDDEGAIGRAIALALDRHEVTVVMRAREALARIAAGARYDVLLCDLMMPETTGMDFYEQLGTIAPELRPRVVFLTGGAFTEGARRFLESVPNDRLDKPFTATALAAAVDRVIQAKS